MKAETNTHTKADRRVLLAEQPPSRGHIVLAAWTVAALFTAFLFTIPYARTPLGGTEPFLPAYAAAVAINDVITAMILLAQFSSQPSAAVLLLAYGYVLVGLLTLPWALTFPGIFAPSGLLSAGLQTTASIAALRRLAFPIFVLAYAALKDVPAAPGAFRPAWRAILLTVVAAMLTAAGATWLVIGLGDELPTFMSGRMEASSLWTDVASIATGLYVVGIAVLLARRRSMLELWLVVVLCALLIEILLLSYISSGRLSLGWWAGRAFGFVAATLVLVVLLWETTILHTRAVHAMAAEQWAKEGQLASLEAMAASIAHEVNQPLGSMVTNADAALLWIDRPEPDLGEAKAALRRIAGEGHRAGQVVESVRGLFRKEARGRASLQVNDVVSGMLDDVRRYARLNGASVQLGLDEHLPLVLGNELQVRQLLSNLAMNAIEAMRDATDRPRLLRISSRRERGNVTVSVADTGMGLMSIDPESLFEPFTTTKPQGLGMGLMICRSIVEAHGGRIWAAANTPSGSIFTFTIPADETPGIEIAQAP